MSRRWVRRSGVPRTDGFAMLTVIFVMLIMVGVAAALSQWSTASNHNTSLVTREARADAAVRSALQWGAWQVQDPRGTLFASSGSLPDCFASPKSLLLPAPLDEFTVQVTCTRTPASPGVLLEDQRLVAVFVLTAIATAGTVDAPDRVERRLEMRLDACRDPASLAAPWSC